jgi:hypothetical protein
MPLDPDAARIRQRLRALRSRYPGMVLSTHVTHIHDEQVVVRAELSLPDGSSVSAYAAEPGEASGMLDGAIELAEQRATVRALDLMGVGDVAAETSRAEPRPSPAVEHGADDRTPPPVVDALRKASQRRQAAVEREPAPAESREPEPPAPERAPEPELRQAPEPDPERADPPGGPADEPDMADYTWTHFWTWARANDLSTKGQVEQRIGRAIDNLTPRDVRQLLHEHGVPR